MPARKESGQGERIIPSLWNMFSETRVALIVALSLPTVAVSGSCPDTLVADCDSARRSGVGNCLICIQSKHGTACDAEADAFCSGDSAPASCPCQKCIDSGKARALCESFGLDCSCATTCARPCQKCLDTGSTRAECESFSLDCTGCRKALSCEQVHCNLHGECKKNDDGSFRTCGCDSGWAGDACQASGVGNVASNIKGVTAAGLTFIEDALPKGAGLEACVPASLRFTYAPYLWARARL